MSILSTLRAMMTWRARGSAHVLNRPGLDANLGEKAARGAAINIVSQIARIVIQLLGIAVLSRLLSPSDFGLAAMAFSITAFIGIFTDMGLSTATIRRRELNQEVLNTLFLVNISVGLGLAILTCMIAPVAGMLFDDSRITNLVIGLSIAIPLSAAGAQHGALLARDMRWVSIQTIAIISQTTGLAAAVALALTPNVEYWALVGQNLVSTIVALFFQWVICRWRPSLKYNLREARTELSFGFYLSAFSLLNYFHRQFDNVLIGRWYGPVELGYYTRAYSLLGLPISLINNSMSQSCIPTLSRIPRGTPQWESAYLRLLTLAAFGSTGACAALYVIAEPFIRLFLGTKWEASIIIFKYLAVASVFSSITNGCGWAFISLGKTRELFLWSLFASPLFVLSFIAGLPWGAAGVAVAYSTAMAILAPLYLMYTAHHAGFRYSTAVKLLSPPLAIFAISASAGELVVGRLSSFGGYVQIAVGATFVTLLYAVITIVMLRVIPYYMEAWLTVKNIVQARPKFR